uniref:Uncharacterized protein n=1 Tax=Cannabis sativa TaxID=3483 RepID=A0A803Q111_CANSA
MTVGSLGQVQLGTHALYYGITWGKSPGVVPKKVWLSRLQSNMYGQSSPVTLNGVTTHPDFFRDLYWHPLGSPYPSRSIQLHSSRLREITDHGCSPRPCLAWDIFFL